jgi:Ca2+:H+ antiporter
MPRWLWALILVGIAGWVLSFTGASEVLLFALTAVGLVPLAALIGKATEELAFRLGATAGGLLNVTFGNVPELLIGALAVREGLIGLAQATVIGSVIGNASLVVGMSLFYGGLRHGIQRFDREVVGHQAILMVLAVAALALPSLYQASAEHANIKELSLFVAVLLIFSYVAYLLYDLVGFRGGPRRAEDGGIAADTGEGLLEDDEGPEWSTWAACAALAFATVFVALEGDVLVGSVSPVVHQLGIGELFVGLVIVPIVGNVAEHFSAVQFAGRNKMDLSFAIASGSSIQVAVLVAPLLVLISTFWHPMTLVFNPVEITVLALVVVMFYFVAHDGESNWLVGLQLMTLYLMAAAVFYVLPSPAGL